MGAVMPGNPARKTSTCLCSQLGEHGTKLVLAMQMRDLTSGCVHSDGRLAETLLALWAAGVVRQ